MHQLGYELPERAGFGGLWEAVAEAAESATSAGGHRTAGEVESEPEIVAHSDGPSSARTRAVIAAFRRTCCDTEAVAA
jgi:hypothetical protein